MNQKERWTITAILIVIAVLVSVDVYNDFFEGVDFWHISIEFVVGIISIAAVFYLLRGHFKLKRSLTQEQQFSDELQIEAEKWKKVSKKYTEGLSIEIENQLDHWNLTKSEKEVAFLLVKGLSNKEIAEIRKTSVPTVRTQTNAIYSKSGLSGRSELSAFFLEELLLPQK